MLRLFGRSTSDKVEKSQMKLEKMYKQCAEFADEVHTTLTHETRKFNEFSRFIRKTDKKIMQELDIKMIIWTILMYYIIFSKKPKKRRHSLKKNRSLKKTEACYERIVKILFPDKDVPVIEAAFTFIETNRLWRLEFFCAYVFSKMTVFESACDMIFLLITGKIEKNTSPGDLPSVKKILSVMNGLLKLQDWEDAQEAKNTISRVVELYLKSSDAKNSLFPLNKGIEVCVRTLIEKSKTKDLQYIIQCMGDWILRKAVNNDDILCIGSLIEYAAVLHRMEGRELTFGSKLLLSILKMIGSQNKVTSLVGSKVLYQILNRNNNMFELYVPKIFFQGSHLNIIIPTCRSDDKKFLETIREEIHDSFLQAFLNHGASIANLEGLYRALCILSTEVPCSFTAAMVTCLIMNVQETIVRNSDTASVADYRIHACIASIMSLTCWLHGAVDFYNYINGVIKKRADIAPHLLPPIRTDYSYALHHVLWNKPELFFNDWDVRYGLWMTFAKE